MDKKILIRVRAIILYEGKLLAVRGAPDSIYVALPGGHLEYGEDVKECLSRELVEELGVKPEIGRLLYINTFIQADEKQSVEFFFEIKNGADYLNPEKNIRSHAFEISQIIWINPTDDIKILPKSLMEDFKAGKIISDEVRFIKD